MSDDDIVEKIRKKYERLSGTLNERSRGIWASAEDEALGYGGQTIVAKATGLWRMTFLLSTAFRNDAVTFRYDVMAYADRDFHPVDKLPLWAHE